MLVVELLIELVIVARLLAGRLWAWVLALLRTVGTIIGSAYFVFWGSGSLGDVALLVVAIAMLAILRPLRASVDD